MGPVQEARVRKTKLFFSDRDGFMTLLRKDIASGITLALRKGLIPVFRLNGTSDIRWETVSVTAQNGTAFANVMALFPGFQFYDYTKLSNRKNLPANYHLTFSQSENNQAKVDEAFTNGMNVATVFHNVPFIYNNRPVCNGDADDLRFLDPKGVYIGLKAKGMAKYDTDSGFVV